jgi:hypothetical protein
MQSLIQKAFLFALIVITTTWISGVCRAQEYRATITGTVTDAARAVIPNAPVTVRNLDHLIGIQVAHCDRCATWIPMR